MSLTWHITKKDLQRLAAPLVGLVLVALIQVFIGLALRSGDGVDMVWFDRMQLYLNLARGAEALVSFLLVGLLVHEDSLVGSHVFWRTRPISNGMLLRSKLLTGALIFGVLPLVIALPWWLVCGYGPVNMAAAALEMWGWTLFVIVPASALAVLSDNLSRYLTLAVLGYALGFFSLLMRMAYLPKQELTDWGVMQSRSVIALVLVLVGWLVIVAWQFLRRSRVVPQTVLIFLVLVFPLVMSSWPKDIFAAWRPRQDDSSEQTRDITLTTSPARIDYADNVAKTLELTLRAERIPADRVFASIGADLFWQARSGQLYASGFNPFYYGGNDTVVRGMLDLANIPPDPETVRWEKEKRLELRKKLPPSGIAVQPPLPPEEARKTLLLRFGLVGTATFEPPNVKANPELRMDVVVGRPQKREELALEPTGWRRIGGLSLRITQVRTVTHPAASNGLATAYEEKAVSFIATEPEGEWIAPHWHLFHVGTPVVLAPDCWLVSRELGLAHNAGPIAPYSPSVRIDGVQVVWRTATVAEPRVVRNGVWTGYIPDWDKKFSLVFFSYAVEGQFRRTVKLEQIKQNRKQQDEAAEPTP